MSIEIKKRHWNLQYCLFLYDLVYVKCNMAFCFHGAGSTNLYSVFDWTKRNSLIIFKCKISNFVRFHVQLTLKSIDLRHYFAPIDMSTYAERYSESCHTSKIQGFVEIIIAISYTRKMLHFRYLTGPWICLGFSKYRDLNMPEFWKC